jgi:peptide/nickel transport system permease protein
VRYAATRLVQLILVLLVVSFLAFLMVRVLPGDPVLAMTGCPEDALDVPECAEKVSAAREGLRLDEPLFSAYFAWLSDLLPPDIDLGTSYVRNEEVSEALAPAIPRTALLMLYSVGLGLVLAVPLGVLAAYKSGGWTDRIISTSSFGVIALPNFILAVLLVYVFAITLGWFPATAGQEADLSNGLVNHIKGYTLPVLSLGLGLAAVFTRLLRTDMVATLSEDFIGMAKAKGMPVRRILFSHALRPSSFTLLTVVGLNIGQLIGGAVIIEFIFGINGIGTQMVGAVQRSDYTLLQGGIVIVAFAFITINLVVDLLYGVLDPRVRHARN